MRIVSLLPAATEIVWALGLADDLVGVSHACDHPAGVAGRPVLTRRPVAAPSGALDRRDGDVIAEVIAGGGPGPAEILVDQVAALEPDLVLVGPPPAPGTTTGRGATGRDAAGRGRSPGGAADRDGALRAALPAGTTVVVLEPVSLEGVFHAIATVGAMTAAEDEAVGLVEILRERLADVEEVVEARREQGRRAPRVVALEWLDPPTASGLWLPEQVRRAGGWEVLGTDGAPAVTTTWDAVEDLDPEMLLLAPGGMHLGEAVAAWRAAPRPVGWAELRAVRHGHVIALDAAAYFSRPGPRVIDGIELLAEIFDPAAFVDLAPVGSWVPVE